MDENPTVDAAIIRSEEAWRAAHIQVVLAEMKRYGLTIADLRKDVDLRDVVTTTFTNAVPSGSPNAMCHTRVMHEPTGATVEIAGPSLFRAKEQAMAKLLDILFHEYGYNRAMVNITRTQTPHQPSGNTAAGE